MGEVADGMGRVSVDAVPSDSVTGVAGPVLLAATVPDLSRGDVLAGRYQIEAAIGTGGSGRVLRAFDRVTRSLVALKILRSEFAADPVWTERFSRELRVGRQIQHPNVCRVHDIGEADGHRFLSMELATGGTLRSQMEPGAGPRSVDDRVADARAIIQGVAALHTAGIVHRDLKPENILRADDGRLLVSDFGLATDPGSGPATTIMIGTPRYMAPEVVMGDPATARSDVWALGVVMHEVLSGERPDRSLIKRRRRIYTPPEVGSVRERRLVELCARCSEEDPAARPASAVELRREFEAAAAGRRFGNRALKKQIAWAAVAVAALASLGIVRNRWTSNAVASSSQAASAISNRAVPATGPIADWTPSTKQFASLSGAVHCFSLVDSGRRIRVVWGNPRRAEDVAVVGGGRTKSPIGAETFATGCPQESPDGKRLLFQRASETGSHIFLSSSADGAHATQLVRGESPVWLPNAEEFLFELDGRHAGMFSIPTGEMSVVGDQVPGARRIAGVAVGPDGHHAAIRYVSDTMGSLIMLHALPGLELTQSIAAPFSMSKLQFSPAGESVLFAAEGDGGSARMLAWNWRRNSVQNLGAIKQLDVRGILQTGAESFVFARQLRRNIWVESPSGANQLTDDGESDNGSVSDNGELVIQKHAADGTYRIVFRARDGREYAVSDGPLDLTPAFVPGGRTWLHARVSTHEVMLCRTSDRRCTVAVSDPLMPLWPVASPSGTRFAYITTMNQPRLRMANLDGRTPPKDLGACGTDCAPIWTAEDRIWVLTDSGTNSSTWAEIDANLGVRTGNTEATSAREGTLGCAAPPTLLKRMANGTHMTFDEHEESVILRSDRGLI